MKQTLLLIFVSSLMACGEKASFDTVEMNRTIAKNNAEFTANQWRNKNAKQYKIQVIGDSTISPDCAPGDGWSTVFLLNPDTGDKHGELKCSTVSLATGCLLKADFQDRDSYASQDGHCNTDLPSPLPKIGR